MGAARRCGSAARRTRDAWRPWRRYGSQVEARRVGRRQVRAGPWSLRVAVAAGEGFDVGGPHLGAVAVQEAAADAVAPQVIGRAVQGFAQPLDVVEVDL